MTKKPYTKADLKKFDRLTERASSRDQMERITARLALTNFIKEHGKEKCDLMWSALTSTDAPGAA